MALKRRLGLRNVFTMAAGAMISSGLFVLPVIVFGSVGPGIFISYLLAALMLLPSLLSKAELMTAMPKAGGTYFHVDRSFGPTVGVVGGIANWAALAFKGAFALIGIGAFAAYAVPFSPGLTTLEVKAVALVFCLVFALLNLLGTEHAGRVQDFLVGGLLIVLVGYIAWGAGSVQGARFSALLPHGWNRLFVGAAMVFVSFGGVTQVANLAEEVRDPKRDLVVGMFAAYALVSLLYVAVTLVTVGVMPTEAAQWGLAPLSQAASHFAGRAGAVALGAAALLAYMTTGNASILTASRTLMAMSQDGLVPRALGRVNPRGVPKAGILFTSGFMAAGILALPLELFVKAASAMLVLLLLFEVLAVVVMRESRLPSYRPTWRSPLYPWTQALGAVFYLFMLVELGSLALAVAGLILGAGLLCFALYSKVQGLRESALVRLAERLASADFEDHDLEAELSAIVRERDEVARDRFDELVEACPVVDLPGRPSREEVLRAVAEQMAPGAGLSPERTFELLQLRERLSSTVVRPGVAVPHLVGGQVERFTLVLVRAGEGADFADGDEPVYAVFAIASPTEEHDFYLRALVAVSQITQAPRFHERWRGARSPRALREAVLAAERSRE
ncbi:MAG: amino acid permease [Planctomycetota bacterium]